MSDKKIWFGTLYPTSDEGTSTDRDNSAMRWVPAPDTGMSNTSKGYSETIEFENGGANVVGSRGMHRVWSMDWNLAEASGAQGLDIIPRFKDGFYGEGLIYWADPMNFDQNLFAPSFATPGLSELGWPSIWPGTTTYLTNLATEPHRYANFVVPGGVVGALPVGKNGIEVVPIPPTHNLHVGYSATVSGGAAMAARPILIAGGYGPITYMTALSPTGTTRMNLSFSGATYKGVEFFISRSTVAAGSIAMYSAMAQLWPIGTTPILTGSHIPGRGQTGAKFSSDAVVENYVMVDQTGTPRHYKGMSVDLIEVGAWLP